jgi:hypothetical protein
MPGPISALCVCFSTRTPSGCSSGRVEVWKENLFKSLNACREKQRDGSALKCPNEAVLHGHIQDQAQRIPGLRRFSDVLRVQNMVVRLKTGQRSQSTRD